MAPPQLTTMELVRQAWNSLLEASMHACDVRVRPQLVCATRTDATLKALTLLHRHLESTGVLALTGLDGDREFVDPAVLDEQTQTPAQ